MKQSFRIQLTILAVVLCSALFLASCGSDSKDSSSDKKSKSSTQSKASEADLNLSSDPSVTKHPKEGAKFGNGQVLTFEYDGSKSDNDEYATLSYDLYYVQDDGKLIPMGGAFLDGKGSGTFKTTDDVFNSAADGKQGVLELQVTYGSTGDFNGNISGKTVVLGRYLVNIEVSK